VACLWDVMRAKKCAFMIVYKNSLMMIMDVVKVFDSFLMGCGK